VRVSCVPVAGQRGVGGGGGCTVPAPPMRVQVDNRHTWQPEDEGRKEKKKKKKKKKAQQWLQRALGAVSRAPRPTPPSPNGMSRWRVVGHHTPPEWPGACWRAAGGVHGVATRAEGATVHWGVVVPAPGRRRKKMGPNSWGFKSQRYLGVGCLVRGDVSVNYSGQSDAVPAT
jgi:hypothetical protein